MAARSACVKQFYEIVQVQRRILSIFCQPSRNSFIQLKYLGTQFRYNSGSSLAVAADNQHNAKPSPPKTKPIWYYDNKGIRQRKIDQLMRKARELQTTDRTEGVAQDVHHMRNVMTILNKCEFTEKEMNRLFVSTPKVLSVSKKTLYTHVMDLKDCGYPVEIVKKMIMRSPGFLLDEDNTKSIPKRVSHLKSLDITPKLTEQKCVYLVQKCPYLLNVKDVKVLQSKLALLKRLGLNESLIYELVMKNPNVLTLDENSIRNKVLYITKKLGGRIALMVKFPRTFTSSLQRIKERHHYLVKEGFMQKSTMINERKLRAIVLTTDNDFVYRVTHTRMKDYREFQQQFREEELGKELDGQTHERLALAQRVKELGKTQGGDSSRSDEGRSIAEGDIIYEDGDLDEDGDNNVDEMNDSERELEPFNGAKTQVYDAFSKQRRRRTKHMTDEEWYNSPFPEIDHDQDNYFQDLEDERDEEKPKKTTASSRKWMRKNRK